MSIDMSISDSVGQGGRNLPKDVSIVQQLLKKTGLQVGRVDGICGPKTLVAILQYQRQFLAQPDGRIDPNGATWRRLNSGNGATHPAGHYGACPPSQWAGDSSQWSQEKKLASMEPNLRSKVPIVMNALRVQGFQPKIFYAWRSVAVQQRLVAEGKSTVHFSFHNAQQPDGTPNSFAADIIDQRWGWEKEAKANGFWAALGTEAKKAGLYWGGDWKSFPDEAHVQSAPNHDLAKVKKESGL
jgi:peptidoglycan L-alanyl-D-glutamate endopeptidase CwlK